MTTTYRGTSRLGGPQRALDCFMPLSNGRSIPALGFGTYRLDPSKTESSVTHALSCGFTHIDCAPVYGNEMEVGVALKKRLSVTPREKLFITSKLWPTDQSPAHVEESCLRSINHLNVGYLDLYLMHWPICWKRGSSVTDYHPAAIIPNTDVSLLDTWRAMEKLVDKGLVRSIGFCNLNDVEAKHISDNANISPTVHQMEIHPGFAQTELRNVNRALDLVTASYCPFGLPTRFSKDFQGVANHPFLKPLCEQSGFSPFRLLLNWNLDQNNVVIVKSENPRHIEENAKAQKYALSESVKWMLNHFEDKVEKMRVMNPIGFKGKSESFFP